MKYTSAIFCTNLIGHYKYWGGLINEINHTGRQLASYHKLIVITFINEKWNTKGLMLTIS